MTFINFRSVNRNVIVCETKTTVNFLTDKMKNYLGYKSIFFWCYYMGIILK